MAFFQSRLFQFLVGGGTLVLASWLADQPGAVMTQLAAIVSTLPVLDMLPVLFVRDRENAQAFAWKNAVANVGVIVGMLTLWLCLRAHLHKGYALGLSLLGWLVVAVCLAIVLDLYT